MPTGANTALGKDCFQRAVDLLMQNGKCLPAAEALSNLGSLCHLYGELDDALNCYRRALEIFQELGNEQGQSQTEANLGLIYQSKGEYLSCRGLFAKEPGGQR